MPAKMPQHVREEQLNALPNMRFVEWDTSARRRAIMICEIDGHVWSSKVDNLIYGKRGCPKCAYVVRASKRRAPKDLVESKLRELSGMSFIKWLDGYSNNKSKLTMRCDVCQHVWDTTATQMLSRKSGCAKCAGNLRYDQTELESSLNLKPNARFVRWEDAYVNCYSKAVMQCDAGHQWSAACSSLLCGRGCPKCAKYGFNPARQGTLYALRSKCGTHVKVGISNDFKRRLSELVKRTPHEFSVVALVEGKGHDIRDLEKVFHSHFESSGFEDFDGATEWLKFDPDILGLFRVLGA